MEFKSKIIGCRYNSYVSKKTGEWVERYQLFVVSPIYDNNGLFCGYAWPIDYRNLKAFKSMPVSVSVDEFQSWGLDEHQLINCDCDVYYDNYGNIAKVNPVISE